MKALRWIRQHLFLLGWAVTRRAFPSEVGSMAMAIMAEGRKEAAAYLEFYAERGARDDREATAFRHLGGIVRAGQFPQSLAEWRAENKV